MDDSDTVRRGRAGEQGQRQHEGRRDLGTERNGPTLLLAVAGRMDGLRHGTARHGTVRAQHGAARRNVKEYGIYRAENERYDPPRPRHRSRRGSLFSLCPLRGRAGVSPTNDRIAEIPLRPSLPLPISFFPSILLPSSIPPFRRTVRRRRKRDERSFSPWRRRCDGEAGD